MAVKVFTVEQANRILPVVEEGVRFVRSRAVEIIRTQDRLEVLGLIGADSATSPEHKDLDQARQTLETLVVAYNDRLQELSKLGCVLKDLNHGLVDFYCRGRGKLVFLCWRLGEKEISFWHDLDGGFAKRRPIRELMAEEAEAEDGEDGEEE